MNQTKKQRQESGPQDGDVLLSPKAGSAVRFTVSVIPGPAQVAFASYRKALASARTFAGQRGATLWVQRDGTEPFLIRDRRRTRSAMSIGVSDQPGLERERRRTTAPMGGSQETRS